MFRGTILIVDDEESILANSCELLGGEYTILTARSAAEAMRLLAEVRVHVIVSDYKMPGRDGLSFLIETKECHPSCVRVLMTAYADMELVVRALNEGEIHRFVSKPFTAFELRSILRDCLRYASVVAGREIGSRSKSVLVAHDSAISLSTLKIGLSPSYRVFATSNGLDVLTIIASNTIDALIIGVGLEMMDGCTITSYLKREKSVPFPIVIWSSDISGPFEEHLRECGTDLCIDERKPDSSRLLRDFLRERLG